MLLWVGEYPNTKYRAFSHLNFQNTFVHVSRINKKKPKKNKIRSLKRTVEIVGKVMYTK